MSGILGGGRVLYPMLLPYEWIVERLLERG
jgi:hypothetical protein